MYYRALQRERASIDRYVASLDVSLDSQARAEQIAFWLNTYNALVLRTVIDRYPIRGSAPPYPAGSIRQIPGAFDGRRHRVAGRSLTLDDIEAILGEFGDPRVSSPTSSPPSGRSTWIARPAGSASARFSGGGKLTSSRHTPMNPGDSDRAVLSSARS